MFRRSVLWAAVPWLSSLPRRWQHVAGTGGRISFFVFRLFNALSARRDPYHAFVFAASLFAFAYETPAFVLALLLERRTTRADDMGKSTISGAACPWEGCALVYRLISFVQALTVYAIASASKKAATFNV